MKIEVVTASKFPQPAMAAPSSVSVITADDIRTFGYRTLSDVLRSVRGVYVSNDRFYEYVGVRGFKPPGDYNGRILLLVNGLRTNDPIYDSASIGTDFPVDLDLVDRIEIVRGPGSSIYGSNAFFAVVNVITKSGGNIDGLRLSGSIGGFGTDQESATFGKSFSNGLSVLLSASRLHRRGQNLFFPEFNTPETNNGVADHLDWNRTEQFLAKLDYAGFTLTAIHSERDTGLAAAPYGMVFNDRRAHWLDTYTYVDLSRRDQLSQNWSLDSRVFYGLYLADGLTPYSDPASLAKDKVRGEWWGTELKFLADFGRHKLVFGGEYQDNLHQNQESFNITPAETFLDDKRSSQRVGFYVQDEMTLTSSLLLNAGIRYDRYSGIGDTVNPRLALIWSPDGATTVKALYGTAFRAPNAYELFYRDGSVYGANPDLKPETIKTYELVLEHHFGPRLRVTADVYHNDLDKLIAQELDPVSGLLVFRNTGGANTDGVEVEVEKFWTGGARVRASYAWQLSRDNATGRQLPDSPQSLAKVNLSVPLFRQAARVGVELQYADRRLTLAGGSTSAHLLTNLTLTTDKIPGGIELSASLYNVFDVKYADPGGPDLVQDKIMQDGRSFRVMLSRKF